VAFNFTEIAFPILPFQMAKNTKQRNIPNFLIFLIKKLFVFFINLACNQLTLGTGIAIVALIARSAFHIRKERSKRCQFLSQRFGLALF
jgi:prepilin signal peptidase PulO-like enzyme (type II secretory pathway)